jgi:hypothetical protein
MGHRHTSAQFGGHSALCDAGRGAHRTAALSPDAAGRPALTRSPAAALLFFAIRIYQAALSPYLGGTCKFYPSCSRYAAEAVELHGARRGAWLALKRLLRCRPFSHGGFDPVPESEEPVS